MHFSRAQVVNYLAKLGFVETLVPGTHELVLECPTDDPNLRARVYTSVGAGDRTREKGTDAGKVILVNKAGKGVWRCQHVHRTKSFVRNLARRCREAKRAVTDLKCPACDGSMVARKRRGEDVYSFYGCVSYPTCSGTRSIER